MLCEDAMSSVANTKSSSSREKRERFKFWKKRNNFSEILL